MTSSSSSSHPSTSVKSLEILELTEKLYPKTLKTKLGEMILNVGKNYERYGGSGYVIDKVTCRGAINRLAECFYEANFNPPKKRRGKTLSGRAWGSKFHRQIYHKYKCITGIGVTCSCEKKFGIKTKAARKDTTMYGQLESFKNFLKDTGWQVLDCELVVGWRDIECATSLDVVCVDNLTNPKNFYVIELKTGYTQRYQPRTKDNTGKMKGTCGRLIENSYANHHQLQLWFGVECIKRTYDIDTAQAVVLYIKNDGKYKADYASSWWFNNLKMREMLRNQLCGTEPTFSLC